MESDDCGEWQQFPGTDVVLDECHARHVPAGSEVELEACRAECLSLGYGGFVARRGIATFRPRTRKQLLEQRTKNMFTGGVLYVAPAQTDPPDGAPGVVTVSYGGLSRRAASDETLAARSGYFASFFRHGWADAAPSSSSGSDAAATPSRHATFAEFPGGERAFELAAAWLVAGDRGVLGEPWPLLEFEDVCLTVDAAAYLDAPELLRAAVRSWRMAVPRRAEDLLPVARALISASLQFEDGPQDLMIGDLREMLQELPKHQLELTPEFLEAPAAGLAVLEARHAAKQSLVGHIKNVGGWVVGSVMGASDHPERDQEELDTPFTSHEFAIRLLGAHWPYFTERLPALRRLLCHVDPTVPIVPPLGFRVAASALRAATVQGDEVFAGRRLALDVFDRCFSVTADPAQAAAEDACAVGLFGAGGAVPALGLDVLARPLVPPAAAAVILSRVLSSWAGAETQEGVDAADAILKGVATDRQQLKTMLKATLPRFLSEESPVGEQSVEFGPEWGTVIDFAVPELRAAFAHAAGRSLANGAVVDEAVRLLFQVVFRASGGLPGVRFPMSLFAELQTHGPTTQGLVAQRVVAEVDAAAKGFGPSRDPWATAEQLWPLVDWNAVSVNVLEQAAAVLRRLLCEASAAGEAGRDAAAVRLFHDLPLGRLPSPLEVLGPPVPAHVLACVALQAAEASAARVRELEAETAALRLEVQLLREQRGSS